MTPEQLLAHLESLGVRLQLEDGRLRVNAPKGSLTQELRETIAASKEGLIRTLATPGTGAGADIVPLGRLGPLPVSSFQERVWVLQRIDPENTSFNISASWLLPNVGPLSVMTGILRSLLERHDILRSVFVDTGGTLATHPRPADTVPLAVEDLRTLDIAALDAHVLAALESAPRVPFDLATEVPVRLSVFQLRDDHYAVILCAHHIAVDAWSLSLFGRELVEACRVGTVRHAPTLQFADFAGWQRSTQRLATVAADLEWWSRHLAGSPQLSLFPPDQQPSGASSGRTRDYLLEAELADRLRAAARQNGVTEYMMTLAALATVLHWHTGQDDVVFGSPMGVRERTEFEETIGPFVNLLLIRFSLGNDPTFETLLTRVRNAVLDAHAHRSTPFESVVERLKPARTLEYSPLFQVAAVHHNATSDTGVDGFGMPGRVRSGGAMHEITLFLRDLASRDLECSFDFRSDLYSDVAIDRIASLMRSVLERAVQHPGTRLSELCTLQGRDRTRALSAFNPTPTPLDTVMFPACFTQQAQAHPDAVAMVFEGTSLTFGELDHRSNQLGRRLASHGVGRGTLVGICLDRSPDLVVALLAVQKTGAAYVPLDPAFPHDRLRYMLTDSGSSMVVTTGQRIDVPVGVRRFDLAEEAVGVASEPGLALDRPVYPEDPVYVIYTSGSTGRPKGVVIPHRALMNFLRSMAVTPGLRATDVLAAVTTISFDIAGLELYLPLLVGARIELLPRDAAADGRELAARLAASGATIMQATPATWRLLIEADWVGAPGFRALCGGEALPHDLAQALCPRVTELWNLYGPTETTIWSTVGRVEQSGEGITIGRPIANTQIYLHGTSGSLVPIGLPGEICIGGAGVALGYHGLPDLTDERFITNPYSDRPDAKLYRTGDFGRWREDGQLEHLGRLDHQVKIRGFRIELGEIEAVLAQYAAVRQAVVQPREAAPGDLRLVAYVVCHPGEDLIVSDVRRYLRGMLPEYMVPAIIVSIDAVPLTANGKVDRAALPDPFKSGQHGTTYQKPAAGLEQAIADIWSDVLRVERVGAHDNFFELGGHSLLSLRVAAAVEQRSGWRMDPRLLFFQTLSQIAAIGTASLGGAPRKDDTAVLRNG